MATDGRVAWKEREEANGEEEKEEEREAEVSSGQADVMQISVLGYQRTDTDYTYDIEVDINKGTPLLVHHRYDDIKWLHRMLARTVDLGGHILPPLPLPPPPSLLPHLEKLGPTSSTMFGDSSRQPCLDLEVFLQSLADHPFFSENHFVHLYLTRSELPSHDYIGNPSLWTSLTKAYSTYQLNGVLDSDDDFVLLLGNLNNTIPVIEMCSQAFNDMIGCWQKLACSELAISECVKEEAEWEEGRNDSCSLTLTKLSSIMEEDTKAIHAASLDATHTIGFTFDLSHRHAKQAKEMLYRRLEVVQTLLAANRQLDRTQPEKKEAAEAARSTAMTAYERINTTAKEEMERLRIHSALSYRSSLSGLAESQLTHSRCLLAQLSTLHEHLRTQGATSQTHSCASVPHVQYC